MAIAAPARILFGMKSDWLAGLKRSSDPGRHSVFMADLATSDLRAFDAIVPLTLADQRELDQPGQTWPALIVPAKIRSLCHDKLSLNRSLIDLGFGDFVPALVDALPPDLAAQPVILKPRRGQWGQDAAVLDTDPTEEALSMLSTGTHFVQRLVPGRFEWATHVLMHRGEARFCQTIEYDMGAERLVKGKSHVPVASRWLAETPAQAKLLQMLQLLGLRDGVCCIDYRMVDGKPLVFEINPRFGGSLATRVAGFLDAYLACIANQTA